MNEVFTIGIETVQPTQLYISSRKLAKVLSWFNPHDITKNEPLPVKMLDNQLILTDGHTRAFAAHLFGLINLTVCWEKDEWDWDAYRVCIRWCQTERIHSVIDLTGRVVTAEEYEKVWHDRCRRMHEELGKTRRNSEGGER